MRILQRSLTAVKQITFTLIDSSFEVISLDKWIIFNLSCIELLQHVTLSDVVH